MINESYIGTPISNLIISDPIQFMCNLDIYDLKKKVQITISSTESQTAFKSQNSITYAIQVFPRNKICRDKIEKQKYESKLVNFIKYSR